MNNEPTSLFELAPKRLQWLSSRQKAVSENIANSDVAGFRAKEVESFASYLDNARATSTLEPAKVQEAKTSWSEDLTGNNVVLEEQLMEANSTAGQFRIAAGLYRKAYEMLGTVVGRR